MTQNDPVTPTDHDLYAATAREIMARSAVRQGTIADQLAGDAAAALGLRRTAALAETFGRPQDGLAIVHVAGSKGKGSTVAFIAAMLAAGGDRTGRFTSPHLAKLTERIAIDEWDLDDRTFAVVADRVLAAAEELERARPDLGLVNAFEVLFVMALVTFREARCRVAVIEVGIGGRLDTTNIVAPAVSVITTLDLEHTAILGDTLAEIAAEKAGIVKPGRPVVVAPQPESALEVIRARAAAMGSRLIEVGELDPIGGDRPVGLAGPYQRLNAALAVAAVRELGTVVSELAVDDDAIRAGVERAWLPGRFEVVPPAAVRQVGRLDAAALVPTVVLDGAHSPRAAGALRVSLDGTLDLSPAIVAVCGFAADKDIPAFLRALRPDWILPVAAASPRAVPASTIAAVATTLGIGVVDGPGAVAGGLARLLTRESVPPTVVVTGSFGVVAEARAAFGLPAGRQ